MVSAFALVGAFRSLPSKFACLDGLNVTFFFTVFILRHSHTFFYEPCFFFCLSHSLFLLSSHFSRLNYFSFATRWDVTQRARKTCLIFMISLILMLLCLPAPLSCSGILYMLHLFFSDSSSLSYKYSPLLLYLSCSLLDYINVRTFYLAYVRIIAFHISRCWCSCYLVN